MHHHVVLLSIVRTIIIFPWLFALAFAFGFDRSRYFGLIVTLWREEVLNTLTGVKGGGKRWREGLAPAQPARPAGSDARQHMMR